MPGASGSRGSEVQNFCYDEQNRLVWSGNGGTQPGAGNGTCGSGTLSSGLIGAGYTAPYTYTNLGQIWQGPVNGTGTTRQYLYCSSSHPHQLTGIYPTGTTCSGLSGALYTASYDAWGNETSRTYNSTTATLSYDVLNRLVKYSAGSSQEFYVYDASGTRVLKRSISGGTTTLTTYAYGLQELTYTGAGSFSSQIDYYSVAGHLIGSTNGTSTTYDLTDAQGSVLTTLSASAVVGEQVYGPYGNQRYIQGTLGTDKGYTGQFTDAVTGLDYYNARYYDPVIANFLSPDRVQSNAQGMSPYLYVAGNPETATDPTGQALVIDGGVGNKIALSKNPATGKPYANVNHTPFNTSSHGCGNPGPKVCSSTGIQNGGSTGCTWHTKPCTSTNNPCGSGTVWQGNDGCVSDANSKAGQNRADRLAGKRRLAIGFEIAGYIALFLGDVILAANATSLLEKLEVIVDAIVVIGSNIVPLIAEFFGNGSVSSGWYGAVSALMGVAALAEGAIGYIRKAGWWVHRQQQMSLGQLRLRLQLVQCRFSHPYCQLSRSLSLETRLMLVPMAF